MGIRRVVPDIQTDRMDGSRAFYTDILGFRLGMDEGWVTGVVSPDNETAQIQFMTADATAPVTPTSPWRSTMSMMCTGAPSRRATRSSTP